MENITALILAAGEGKRMKSKNSKVVNRLCGKAMIEWVCEAARSAGIDDQIIIVGHRADQIKDIMGEKVSYVNQDKQLGTGHAVMQAEKLLKERNGHVIVLCGDVPLITHETISKVVEYHKNNDNSATLVTVHIDNPSGYGRIIRNDQGEVVAIIEEKDASNEQKKINEINSGLYCFKIKDLLNGLSKLNNNNSQGEYYLTDLVSILISQGLKVGTVKIDDFSEMLGVNDRVQLSQAAAILRNRILTKIMKSGVTLIDPASTYIDDTVNIGIDTVIYPGTIIEGKTTIGEDCIIGPNTKIVDSIVANSVEIQNSVVVQSKIGEETHVGPFAYIRPDSDIGSKVRIGDFVEVKKSHIGDRTKVAHLSYIGDAEVGSNVNVGCGVVFVNYDGTKKSKTVVGDNAFIGSNVNLIAPVVVSNNAFVAAGSTITDEVPENSLAIARSRQTVKENWVIEKGKSRK